jgi:hypothetical protein
MANSAHGIRITSKSGDTHEIPSFDEVQAGLNLRQKALTGTGFVKSTNGVITYEAGSGSGGRGFYAWNSSTAMTNISQITGMAAGDYVVNTYSAAVNILGASRAIGDVVQATSATAGTLAGNIRGATGATGATGAQGPRGYSGSNNWTTININGYSIWDNQSYFKYDSYYPRYIPLGSIPSNALVHYNLSGAFGTNAMNGATAATNENSNIATDSTFAGYSNASGSAANKASGFGYRHGMFNCFEEQYDGYYKENRYRRSLRHQLVSEVTPSNIPNAAYQSGCASTTSWQFIINTYYGEIFLRWYPTFNVSGRNNLINQNFAKMTFDFSGNFSAYYQGSELTEWSFYEQGSNYSPYGYSDAAHPIIAFPVWG